MSGNTILVVLLILAMIATVVALVRGVIAFLQDSSAQVKGQDGPGASQVKSNRMMQQRIFFQAIAVMIVVVILVLAGKN